MLGCATLGGYFSNYKRQGANSWLSHFYVNIRYQLAKENLIKNFEVLNRGFTEDEINQFNHNANLQRLGRKKYVYNPRLHATEEEYRKEYERMNSGEYTLSEKSQLEIESQGANKVSAGEKVVQKPFAPATIDISERNLGIINNNAFERNHHLN